MERQHMKCILKVDTRSSGWEKSVTKVIKCVKDVSYSIDTTRGLVHISGDINPHKLLMDIRKGGKHAELLLADCVGSSHSHSHQSNYRSHGYHGYDGGYGYSDPHHHQAYHHHHHQSRPAGGYLQSYHNTHVLPSAPPPQLQWHPQSYSPPSYEYDQYNPNPSCNIM